MFLSSALTGYQRLANLANHLGASMRSLPFATREVVPAYELGSAELSDVTFGFPSALEWPPAYKWIASFVARCRELVRTEVVDLKQPYSGVIVTRFTYRRVSFDVAIDFSDYPRLNDECARQCPVYFKMQYQADGYEQPHILPGGYVAESDRIYGYLPYLRRVRNRGEFEYEVYGRFSLDYASAVRRRAVEMLGNQQAFRFEGGLVKVSFVNFLKEISRSKICIDLPGNGDFCHRLISYFAVGACVIGPRHGTLLNAPLIDRRHIVYTKDDLSDLTELCEYYLANESEREAICRNSRNFFDRYLHRNSLTAYYLRVCLNYAKSLARQGGGV